MAGEQFYFTKNHHETNSYENQKHLSLLLRVCTSNILSLPEAFSTERPSASARRISLYLQNKFWRAFTSILSAEQTSGINFFY